VISTFQPPVFDIHRFPRAAVAAISVRTGAGEAAARYGASSEHVALSVPWNSVVPY